MKRIAVNMTKALEVATKCPPRCQRGSAVSAHPGGVVICEAIAMTRMIVPVTMADFSRARLYAATVSHTNHVAHAAHASPSARTNVHDTIGVG